MSAVVQTVGSKSQFSAHRGCSPAYVSKLIRLGRLAAPALMPDGKVNFILADQMLGAPVAEERTLTPASATDRQRRERADADLRELELQERSGRMLRAVETEAAQFAVARRARDAVLAVPDGAAAELHACTTERQLADLLRLRLTEALATLADALETGAGNDGP
jgi:hypothetical protein